MLVTGHQSGLMPGIIKSEDDPKKSYIKSLSRKVPIEKVSIQIENKKNNSLEAKSDRRVTIETEDPASHFKKQLQSHFGNQCNDLTAEQIFSILTQPGILKDFNNNSVGNGAKNNNNNSCMKSSSIILVKTQLDETYLKKLLDLIPGLNEFSLHSSEYQSSSNSIPFISH